MIPVEAVSNADRYKGTVEDERRLFYVALTRAEKYLFCSWAPIASNQQQRNVSEFLTEFTHNDYVLTREPKRTTPRRLPPRQHVEEIALPLTFSELRHYFDCPYLFKLRFLYGFDAPIERPLGYGKSLHDALAEIHSEALLGRIPSIGDVPGLVETHLHLPFANAEIRENLKNAAEDVLRRYLEQHGKNLRRLEHVEKTIELKLSDGVVVSGRIDLIRRTDTGEIAIVDFKSKQRAQAEEITERQLHIYALGYERLTGKSADLVEVHNLDRKGGVDRHAIDTEMIESTVKIIGDAGRNLRENRLPRLERWCRKCDECDIAGLCRPRPDPAAVRSVRTLPPRR